MTPQNRLFPVKLADRLFQSLRSLRSFKPDAVVACGGFVCRPVGWVAARLKVPLLLQEQNSFPGVTTLLLAKDAVHIITAFEEADENLPTGKSEFTGKRVRNFIEHS